MMNEKDNWFCEATERVFRCCQRRQLPLHRLQTTIVASHVYLPFIAIFTIIWLCLLIPAFAPLAKPSSTVNCPACIEEVPLNFHPNIASEVFETPQIKARDARKDVSNTSCEKKISQLTADLKNCTFVGVLVVGATGLDMSRAVSDFCDTTPADCLIIVQETRGNSNHSCKGKTTVSGCKRIFSDLDMLTDSTGSFAKELQMTGFGRKNLGYLLAVQTNAHFIWDFDNTNRIIDDQALKGFCGEMRKSESMQVLTVDQPAITLNPFPSLGLTRFSWPRGYPLRHIKSSGTTPRVSDFVRVTGNTTQLALVQGLANFHPDVDAIARQQLELPVYFGRQFKLPAGKQIAIFQVPTNTYVPVNSQATLWLRRNAFWGLYLPVSVSGRVSDIWRGYIFQRIASFACLKVAFSTSAWVEQKRSQDLHNADFNAEKDLYVKTEELIDHLSNWSPKSDSIPDIFVELYSYLHDEGFLGRQDVRLSELWIAELHKIGHTFPAVVKSRCNGEADVENSPSQDLNLNDVTLLVRINHSHGARLANKYVDTWSSYLRMFGIRNVVFFGHRVIGDVKLNQPYGSNMNVLGCEDTSSDKKGFFWYHAATICERFLDSTIGVLFAHDDILFNLPKLANATLLPKSLPWFSRKFNFGPDMMDNDAVAKDGWKWYKGKFGSAAIRSALLNQTFDSAFGDTLRGCHEANTKTVMRLPRGNGDVFYIPRSHLDQFQKAADFFSHHHIFLEIAIPTIAECIFTEKIPIDAHGIPEHRRRPPRIPFPDRLPVATHGVKLSYGDTRDAISELLFSQLKDFSCIQSENSRCT